MSRLPEKGEAWAAADALKMRLHAVGTTDDLFVADVNIDTGQMHGEEAPFRAVFGDLFVIGETADTSQAPVQNFIMDIAGGVNPETALRSLYLLAVAHGALMERARWERKP